MFGIYFASHPPHYLEPSNALDYYSNFSRFEDRLHSADRSDDYVVLRNGSRTFRRRTVRSMKKKPNLT